MCSIRYKLRKIFLINKVTKKTNDIKKGTKNSIMNKQ